MCLIYKVKNLKTKVKGRISVLWTLLWNEWNLIETEPEQKIPKTNFDNVFPRVP